MSIHDETEADTRAERIDPSPSGSHAGAQVT